MITTTKTKKLDLANISSSDINKQILINMAKEGKDKPYHKSKLGIYFMHYVFTSAKTYDPHFKEQIKKLRPEWLLSRSEKCDLNKQKLIEMAKNGEKKPYHKSDLGILLSNYLRDKNFYKTIKKLKIEWVEKNSKLKKQELINIAKSGKSKPHYTSEIGKKLKSYTTKTNGSYDKIFTSKIKKLRPDWFINSVEESIKLLIQMAKNGDEKPNSRTSIGNKLLVYSRNKTEFSKLIKKLRPDWFLSSADINKQRLIELAEKRKPRPKNSTKLGSRLSSYTCKNSGNYCEEFTKQIRKTRPDWFVYPERNKK